MATLIISEKPNACKKIVAAISEKHQTKKRLGVNYYSFELDGETYYAIPAVGHLFNLKHKRGAKLPIFDVEWKPSHETSEHSAFTKKYLSNFQYLRKRVNKFIVATDYDIEGSVIAFTILKHVFNVSDAERMKFSTLTKEDLQHAFKHRLKHINRGHINAGLLRHYLDYYWGVNASRALMNSIKSAGRFKILSIGRVQGPSLKLLYDHEVEIEHFKSKKYYELAFLYDGSRAEHPERIMSAKKAKNLFNSIKGKKAKVISFKETEQHVSPPAPFNLTTLQTTAYRVFGFTPSKTLSTAQSLYEKGLISYPRTSSQRLPVTIGYTKILKRLSKKKTYAKFCEELLGKELKPVEGEKSDPAHPAIYPTGDLETLRGAEAKLYDLVVRRFMAVFGSKAVKRLVRIILDLAGVEFHMNGHKVIKPGFLTYYGKYGGGEEKGVPALKEGDVIKPDKFINEEKETKPPSRYSQASVIHKMDSLNLGTKATRTNILKTLYDRGYITGRSIHVTELGSAVIDILEKYSPRLISLGLTIEIEKNMDLVEEHKLNKDDLLEKSKTLLTDILADFKKHEKVIGEELVQALREDSVLGKCLKCGGNLRIIFSRRTGKRFVGCAGYPKCTNSYPLPQHGLVKNLRKECKTCKAPMIMLIRKKKRPWSLCVNPSCPSKNQLKNKKEGSSLKIPSKQA